MRARVSDQWHRHERAAVRQLIARKIGDLRKLGDFVTRASKYDLETARTIPNAALLQFLDRRLPTYAPVAQAVIATAETPCASCTLVFDDHPSEECGEFVAPEYL